MSAGRHRNSRARWANRAIAPAGRRACNCIHGTLLYIFSIQKRDQRVQAQGELGEWLNEKGLFGRLRPVRSNPKRGAEIQQRPVTANGLVVSCRLG